MYKPIDFFNLFFRGLQTADFSSELENVVMSFELRDLLKLKTIISNGKIQLTDSAADPQVRVTGMLHAWIEFMYHRGHSQALRIHGDIKLLQLLRDELQYNIHSWDRIYLEMSPPVLISFAELVKRQTADFFIIPPFIQKDELKKKEKEVFELYYQLERIEKRIQFF